MEKLGEVLKIIIDNFGYLFGIDFLSLFVSGATCLGAFAFVWIQLAGRAVPSELTQGWGIAVIVLACYVLGMICFAFGRWVRTTLFERFQEWLCKRRGYQKSPVQSSEFLLAVLKDHALSKQDFVNKYIGSDEEDEGVDESSLAEIAYQVGPEGQEIKSLNLSRQYRVHKHNHPLRKAKDRAPTSRLYTRLWAEVRQSPDLIASYTLLNRYWFMAATYDGLATALIVWLIIVIAWSLGLWGINPKLNPFTGITLCGTLVLLTITCWREAERYKRYQIEELVATLAYQKSKLKSDQDASIER
ncbi:hypothetical protein [Pseudanabaena sp. PCC 6802]|uniref:hypothetical protein n=1 Tax=Pseudanabaena sp. PCC 6802 TaxID=118173 RepID=UPI000344AECF|nr:hypothetical protein [Pseudanabaena sp. PCC 6802]